jgi:parallel beta-helix repeat protein
LELSRARDGLVLVLVLAVLAGFLCVAFKVQLVEGLPSIYIKADGSVFPSWVPISSVDNVTYTFNDTITDDFIIVERDNIIIDGAGFTLQMTGQSRGLYKGIRISGRENVTVTNMKIEAFMSGIEIAESSNVTICGNNITANVYGIVLFNSSRSNTVFGNYVADNGYGVYAEGSSNQILYENVIDSNAFCFDIVGSEPSHFVHSIDASNLVNGKPVYYLVNQTDIMLTNTTHPQVGYLALANCTNITVEGLSLADTAPVLLLAYTSNSTITSSVMTNSSIANGWYGVLLESSYNNTFARNNITENSVGILLKNSSRNAFTSNSIKNNTGGARLMLSSDNNVFIGNNIANNQEGISLERSCNNTFAGNNITGNGFGIELFCSFSNSFYHNNFTDNAEHVRLLPSSWPNFWDDGYPSGGNFWSGYSDVDVFSGPYQNETGSDGIWDHPYVMSTENQDNYPAVPEFPTHIMLLALMMFTFVIIAVHKREG